MGKPFISVVMANYNTPTEYLFESIDSILNQTYKNFELIIVNDASDESLYNILQNYTDDRIKIFENKKNMGLASSLNKAIRLAKGNYIARMDTDDISLPKRFEMQVEFLENNPEVGVLGTGAIYIGQRKRIKKFTREHEKIKSSLLFQNQMLHPSVMIRKEIFNDDNNLYNSRYLTSQDYELWSRLVWKTNFYNLPEILLKYRTHGGQLTASRANLQYEMANLVRTRMLSLGNIPLKQSEIDLINKSAFTKALTSEELYHLKELSNKIVELNRKTQQFDGKALMYSLSVNLDRANYIYARENKILPLGNLKLGIKHYYNSYSVQKYFGKYYNLATKIFGKQ